MNEDLELIRRILLGDPDARDDFAWRWYSRIRATVRAYGRLSESETISCRTHSRSWHTMDTGPWRIGADLNLMMAGRCPPISIKSPGAV